MTDDLKEQLLELCSEPPNATSPWPHRVIYYALARITDLEARLAAAEAGEDALAKAGSEARIALAGMVRPYNAVNLLDAALAAYEARREK